MGYYAKIADIRFDFESMENYNAMIKELEDALLVEPITSNVKEVLPNEEGGFYFDTLEDWTIKMWDEDEYVAIMSKYGKGFIEFQGDEIGDFRKFIANGDGTFEVKEGKVVYD